MLVRVGYQAPAEAHTRNRNLQVRLAAAQLREAEQHLHEQAQRCRLTEVHLQSQRAAEDDARGHVVAYYRVPQSEIGKIDCNPMIEYRLCHTLRLRV